MAINSDIIGYLCILISVFGFGSNYAPIKRISIGDGIFFQFILCNAIFMTSLPVLAYQGFPTFHPFAMWGGVLWCTGNMLCGPTIQLIGLASGLLIWGNTCMLSGWASGKFGLFGLTPEFISDITLNYIGVGVAILGIVVFLQVKTNVMGTKTIETDRLSTVFNHKATNDNNYSPLMNSKNTSDYDNGNLSFFTMDESFRGSVSPEDDDKHFGASWSEGQKRIIGLLMAAMAGLMFGVSFDPAQWLIDTKTDGLDDPLNYVFPHFCGIMLSSWSYLIIYCLVKKYRGETPYLNVECILPGTLSGIMWGVAEIAWFIANGHLGFSITFPCISYGPGLVGSIWGVFVFSEITGKKNFILLTTAFLITIPGLIMVSLSH